MSSSFRRRSFLQAGAALLAAAWLHPRFALGGPRNILDGGPWLANVESYPLEDAVTVADAWGRRGIRVLVAVGQKPGRCVEDWERELQRLGWVPYSHFKEWACSNPTVYAAFLKHPSSRRGKVVILHHIDDHAETGGEAAVLDGPYHDLALSVVLRAIAPWPGYFWFGHLHRKVEGRLTTERIERLWDHVRRVTGYRFR